ncbi:hypothetical protein LR48_Vigan04g183800 [Vigna angularis]|uniref:Uncharacterized protein n=2 Tax=Phaseolus angularis TaxID=3914 RepID=A0A0L9UFF7_PHAAN|nr:uncharacterized protein LOC108331329 [Vigna angularis]KAG2399900.1 uncharacterized protein HKW66_Vig0102460 [Vigna angularis]KOM41640.1 hypothetical protein LR48_Vigan04g183800 [Vigna angularis]BAT78575.1 hypothetical protein VIGAN_02127000 [Vigna angularis var. angularis]
MGNENHQQHQFYYQKSTFLPMLCSRPTIKDVTMPRFRDPSAPSANDPLSPRISCMGQVKRNNKIAGIPPSHRLYFSNKTNTSSPSLKYSKLRRLFSGKNFIVTTPKTTTAAAAAAIPSCRSRQQLSDKPRNQKFLRSENNNNVVCMMSIEDMDPPLPVVKRVPKLEEGKELDSLWKRRSGTARPALKSLQLQQIHHPRIFHQPPTV